MLVQTNEWDFGFYRVRALVDDRGCSINVLLCNDWVNVVGVTPEGGFVLVRQFRAAIECSTLELPGGIVDSGLDPLEAAKQEFLEETGYSSSEWSFIGTYFPNPGLTNNRVHSYFCRNAQLESRFFEAGVQPEVMDSKAFRTALYEGALCQAFALATVKLAVVKGYLLETDTAIEVRTTA